jgi:hypothetical protein
VNGFRVHVVGESGVGKSTLINALVHDGVGPLPHGGVGPLTSARIEVHASPEPWLSVSFCSRAELIDLLTSLGDAAPPRQTVRRARMLALGSPDGPVDVTTLQRRLLGAVSRRPLGEGDAPLPGQVKTALELALAGEPFSLRRGVAPRPFETALEDFASGPSSPLVSRIRLGWPSPLLEAGVTLLDLPGLGVANDIRADVASAALAEAEAVLLVVDHRGIHEATTAVLEKTGVLMNLGQGPSGAVSLLVAITKLDEADRGVASAGERLAAFRRRCDDVQRVVGEQLRLLASRALPGPEARSVAGSIPICPVLPREHRNYHAGDPEVPSFLKHADESLVPQLRWRILDWKNNRTGGH